MLFLFFFFRTLQVGWVGFEKCGKFSTFFFLKPSLIYILSGQNQGYSTRIKKSYFGHTFSFDTKKSFLVGGWLGWWVKSDLIGKPTLKKEIVFGVSKNQILHL